MGRTYEAISKSQEFLHKPSLRTSFISNGHLADLRNTKEMGDLKTKMKLLRDGKGLVVFHFVSSREREGVSTAVANVARLLAEEESSKGILLIDGNFKRPALHMAFNVPSSPGMSDVLMGKASYSESIHKTESGRINVMPCGVASDVPGKTEKKTLSDLISAIKGEYDYILIDSSPLLTSSDSLSLALGSDTTFLVIQANRTQWEVAGKAKLELENSGCHVGGVILNRVVHVIPQWIYKRL